MLEYTLEIVEDSSIPGLYLLLRYKPWEFLTRIDLRHTGSISDFNDAQCQTSDSGKCAQYFHLTYFDPQLEDRFSLLHRAVLRRNIYVKAVRSFAY
jgi:hypothetical protein